MKRLILVLTCVVSLTFAVACASDKDILQVAENILEPQTELRMSNSLASSETTAKNIPQLSTELNCIRFIEDTFAPILNAYRAFIQDGFTSQNEYFLAHPTFQQWEWGSAFLLTFPDQLVYAFHDISGNGVSELIVGTEFIEGVTWVFGIYALQDDKPTVIVHAANHRHVSLLINNTGEYVIEVSSGRDRFSGRHFYMLDEKNNLILIDVFIEGSRWESDPTHYSSSYAYRITNSEWISLTQEEYMAFMQMYGSRGSYHVFMWESFPIPARNAELAWNALRQ